MSEMTITDKKLMLAGMFLSRFNRQGLEALGFKSLQEAMGLFPVIREKKRLKPQPSIAQALDFRR